MKPYPAYQESGVEWLGPVPEGWGVMPVKAIATCNDEVLPEDTDPLTGLEYVEISGVDANEGIVETSETTFGAAPSRARRIVRNGDVLISTVRTYLKAVAQVSDATPNLVASTGFAVLRPKSVLSSFLGHVCRSEQFIAQIIVRSVGVSYPAINASQIMALPVPLPSLPEQQAIAAFLDRETAKIDGLIEEQRRLIALLAEKRQATISHAVTRGLNPSARLKPSGVDWLGDVPEGWEVVRLKSDLDYLTSGSRGWAEYYSDEGALFLRIGNLERESIGIDLSDIQRVLLPDGAEGTRTRVASGDLLFSITAFLGSVAVVPPAMEEAYVSQHVALARLRQKSLLPVWVAYSTLSYVGKTYLASQGYGGTKVQLSLDDIANLMVLCPPLDEQGKIVAAVEEHMAQIDALTETATSAIALLQERRSALISAAVTGKIDVRDAQASPVQTRKPLSVSVLLGGVIIAALGRHASMGRMLVQKHLFMAEAHAGVSELQGTYDRQAAGPYDSALQRRVEADLVAAGLLRVAQDGGPGSRVDYEFLGDSAALRADLAAALGDRMARFDDTFRQLADLSKPGIEAVATLYAAWNDFLMDGKNPSRDDIIREVLGNWHPEKREKFTKADLETWLDWMDRHKILPAGSGPKTQTGRLFP